jgi:hypothetical protein
VRGEQGTARDGGEAPNAPVHAVKGSTVSGFGRFKKSTMSHKVNKRKQVNVCNGTGRLGRRRGRDDAP